MFTPRGCASPTPLPAGKESTFGCAQDDRDYRLCWLINLLLIKKSRASGQECPLHGGGVVSWSVMGFPIKTCSVCGEEFELKPDKPGFANRCPECSEPEDTAPANPRQMDADERKSLSEANEARRRAMRDLLYRKDS